MAGLATDIPNGPGRGDQVVVHDYSVELEVDLTSGFTYLLEEFRESKTLLISLYNLCELHICQPVSSYYPKTSKLLEDSLPRSLKPSIDIEVLSSNLPAP